MSAARPPVVRAIRSLAGPTRTGFGIAVLADFPSSLSGVPRFTAPRCSLNLDLSEPKQRGKCPPGNRFDRTTPSWRSRCSGPIVRATQGRAPSRRSRAGPRGELPASSRGRRTPFRTVRVPTLCISHPHDPWAGPFTSSQSDSWTGPRRIPPDAAPLVQRAPLPCCRGFTTPHLGSDPILRRASASLRFPGDCAPFRGVLR